MPTSSQPAFDALAPAYDNAFTHTAIGRYLRQQVHTRLGLHFRAGDHVLELGCGTGEDALYLAGRGVRVMATDVSEAMLDVARAKAQGHSLVRVEKLDLRGLTSPPDPLSTRGEGERSSEMSSVFDGAFSNFGPLNCLDDWRPLAGWLAERVKPGGAVAFGLMSPMCLWEIGWHSLHLDFRTATRRLGKNARFQPDGSVAPMSIHYPTIRRIARDFAPWFRRIHLQGLGLFLPPSDVYGVIEKRPRLLKFLTGLEERFARYSSLATFADHYWIEFERIG